MHLCFISTSGRSLLIYRKLPSLDIPHVHAVGEKLASYVPGTEANREKKDRQYGDQGYGSNTGTGSGYGNNTSSGYGTGTGNNTSTGYGTGTGTNTSTGYGTGNTSTGYNSSGTGTGSGYNNSTTGYSGTGSGSNYTPTSGSGQNSSTSGMTTGQQCLYQFRALWRLTSFTCNVCSVP